MITREVLAAVADAIAKDTRVPQDIGKFTWGCVPASVHEVAVPIEWPTHVLAPDGRRYRGKPGVIRIVLGHKIPLTGVPYVARIRFGYDEEARIVVWSCE